jgi:phage terminase Nu1 subunit (DNA packaging protein)
VPLSVQLVREPLVVPPPAMPPPPLDGEAPGAVPDRAVSLARREAAEAELAEIELAEKRAALVLAADVEARLVNEHTRARTKLLGVPARARQQDPTLTPEHLVLIEDLIREALEDLSGEDPAPAVAAAS